MVLLIVIWNVLWVFMGGCLIIMLIVFGFICW